jgi:hypothetical protein
MCSAASGDLSDGTLLMLLGRSVAEFYLKKEAKFCYLSQKSIQQLATVGMLWQVIGLEVPGDGFETHCSSLFTDVLFVLKSGCSVRCRSLFLTVNCWFRCQFCCHTWLTLNRADFGQM